MIDGISIKVEIIDFPIWRLRMPFDFHSPINTVNGVYKGKKTYKDLTSGKFVQFKNEKEYEDYKEDNNINDCSLEFLYEIIKHPAEYETYRLVMEEIIRINKPTKYILKIKGSLHKNKFNGANYERFYHSNAIEEIEKICNTLEIDSKKAKIENIEIGVNIKVEFVPHSFLTTNLITYKHLQFNQYKPDKKNRRLGYECVLTQYNVKCYDKGLQFDLSYNLMRFELRFKKMQKINPYGIYSLHDLKKPDIVDSLNVLLLDAWNDVLLYEPLKIDSTKLTQLQNSIIRDANNPKYWILLNNTNKRQFHYRRNVLKELIKNYGNGYHSVILAEIGNEWQYLLNPKLYDFTIKVKSKFVQTDTKPNQRFCISCSKDISHQKDNSKFCSPKYVGEVEAHKCRNTDSNKRNNFKNKIQRIYSKGVLFEIEPFMINL